MNPGQPILLEAPVTFSATMALITAEAFIRCMTFGALVGLVAPDGGVGGVWILILTANTRIRRHIGDLLEVITADQIGILIWRQILKLFIRRAPLHKGV